MSSELEKREAAHNELPWPSGHGEGTLRRNIGAVGIIGLGLSIVNGWVAMSSTIVIGLAQGGTPVILYGQIGCSIINAFLITTIAELASAYPTAGGQYVWSAILSGGAAADRAALEGGEAAPPEAKAAVAATGGSGDSGDSSTRHPLSFLVGWATIYEWIVIVAAVSIIASQAIFGLVQTFHPEFQVSRWMVFLVMQCINTNAAIANIFYINRMSWLGTFFLFLSNIVYLVIMITCPATAPTRQPSSFVWNGWENGTGWTNKFVVAATGLVNPGFVWSGVDGAVHIAEDCLDPARTVPMALFSSIGLGFLTGFTMSIALLYSVQDVVAAASSQLPFLTIIVQATQSKAAGVVFMCCFLLVISIMTCSIQMASSRLIWSFARDNGLPFARSLSHVSPSLRVPVLPIVVSWFGVVVLGCLYIASATVYNSIISCCIILQNVAIAVVTVQLMRGGRRMNPNRWLKLGWFGWVCNGLTVAWTVFSTVVWLFPLTPSPTAAEMNWSVVVLAAMALIAGLDWLLYARKHFRGPTSATLDAIDTLVDVSGVDASRSDDGRIASRDAK